MELRGRTLLWLAIGAFVLSIASFIIRLTLGDLVAAPFFIGGFGLAAIAFALSVLWKLGFVTLSVAADADSD